MNYILFDNVNTMNYGAYVFRKSTYAVSAQEYIAQTIPGKNGSLLMRNHRFPDVPMVFSVVIPEDFATNYTALINALLSKNGYQRLYYSEDADEENYVFYECYLESSIEPVVAQREGMGKFDLTFIRKAQVFLEEGETAITVYRTSNIINPTKFEAAPLLRITGVGQVGIGASTITILDAEDSTINDYTDIDCEIGEAYHDSPAYPKNQYVQLSGIDYPKLVSGVNSITLGTGITSVKVVPRWWQL